MQLRRLVASLIVSHVAFIAAATSAEELQCQGLSDSYLTRHHAEPVPYNGDNLVFFLHIPRTAGRTLHACMLKKGTPSQRHCPRAYDHLRINTSLPNCYLLTSHDDFSVVSSLPQGTSVLSHLRDPVDRFLSAYEFAVEVAARAVARPKGKGVRKRNPNAVATEDVWPWSYLSPFFTEDMRQRQAQLKREAGFRPQGCWVKVKQPDGDEFYHNPSKNVSKWVLSAEEQALLRPALDPYHNPLVMPLEEFVRHPIAQELLHNGQTFQVLGITNYSHWGDAGELRACMWGSESVRSHLLDVALARINKFVHVGSTGRLMDSVAAAATALHFNLSAVLPPSLVGSKQQSPVEEAVSALDRQQRKHRQAAGLSLGSEFQRCAFQAQQRNERMEERSLGLIKMPDGRTLHFSKEARRGIPDTVIQEIRRHNSLDLALHAEAEQLLQEHMQQWLQQGVMQQLPTANLVRQQRKQLPKPHGQRPEGAASGAG